MTNAIRARIDQIRQGKVPEGYVRTRAGIMPSDWPTTIKARDVFYSHSVKSNGCGLTVLSATQDRGIIPRSEVDIDIKYDTNNLDNYKKVAVGDFVISLRSFQGGIECSAYEGIISPFVNDFNLIIVKLGVFYVKASFCHIIDSLYYTILSPFSRYGSTSPWNPLV